MLLPQYVPGGPWLLHIPPVWNPFCFSHEEHTYLVLIWTRDFILESYFLIQPSVFPQMSSCLNYLHSVAFLLQIFGNINHSVCVKELGFGNEVFCWK